MVVLKLKRYDRSVIVCSTLRILARNLRRYRELKNFTQEQLAERAGVTYRHYQQIEGEDRPGLQVVTVERLAKALGVSASDLLRP